MPIYEYTDTFLASFVTVEIENRAIEYVSTFGSFSVDWVSKLSVARAYEIICIEYQNEPDDLFEKKRKIYSQEFSSILARARIATPDAEGNIGAIVNIPLERA